MKTLLTVLLISVMGISNGQEVFNPRDLKFEGGQGAIVMKGGDSTSGWYTQSLNTEYHKMQGLDTVQVIMQVSDTSRRYHINYYADNNDSVLRKDTVYLSYGHSISWVIGYSVREKYCCINGNMSNFASYQPVPYYTHLYYLGEDKKPLSKNMYVWISTQLK